MVAGWSLLELVLTGVFTPDVCRSNAVCVAVEVGLLGFDANLGAVLVVVVGEGVKALLNEAPRLTGDEDLFKFLPPGVVVALPEAGVFLVLSNDRRLV